MTKVALINPGRDIRFAMQEPLNLGFIASYLEKNGIDVKIIDELIGEDVKEHLKKFSPDIVGITSTTPLVHRAYEIAKLCKDMGILTVMGGVHVSILPDEALKYTDIVVKGEGELAMLKIIKDGITSGVVSADYIKDLDEIPPPARHLMDMYFYVHSRDRFHYTYLYFVPRKTRVASILAARGCPYRCVFCHNTWRDTPFRANSPERVIFEVRELIDRYAIKAIFFIGDDLFVDKARLRSICELMKKNRINIIWGGNARVDEIDEEILKVVKDAGCRQITFGFESGSQRILDILKKGTTVEQNRRAIQLCKKVGIIPQGTFMVGSPKETVKDILATQRFIQENDVEAAGICVTTPYPGTELWKWCQGHNLIPKDFSWSDLLYDRVVIPCSERLSCKEIERLYRQTAKIAGLTWRVEISEFLETYFLPLWKLPLKIIKALRHPSLIYGFIRILRRLKYVKPMKYLMNEEDALSKS